MNVLKLDTYTYKELFADAVKAVSYTHLDVYKRQKYNYGISGAERHRPGN